MRFIRTIVVKVFEWLIGLFNTAKRLLALFNQYVIAPIKQTTLYIQAAIRYECFVAGLRLRSMSPVATGLLANSWKVTAAVTRGTNTVQVRITNTAPNAFFRIVGRAPGRMPPVAAIRQWCEVKGIDPAAAYPIAKGIGERGTFRWRTESNVLNYIRSTNEYAIPNIWTETTQRIENQLRIN